MHKRLPVLTSKQVSSFCRNIAKANECWIWMGNVEAEGYGTIEFKDSTYKAHRIAYYLHHGIDPGKQCVCHKCDNKVCINPNHLFLGSRADNNEDRDKKGRFIVLRGTQQGGSKLTEDDVRNIRRSTARQRDLATIYGVSQSTIWRARNTHWKHVE